MIKLCDEFKNLPDSFIATRLKATLNAYKGQDFLLNWTQYVDDKPVAYFQKIDDSLTILTTGKEDIEEIKEFISMVGAQTVFCNHSLGCALGYEDGGYVMKISPCKREAGEIKEIKSPDYKKIFEVLNCLFGGLNFEGFYLDFSHRVRHNTARVFANDNYNAVLTVGWETEDSAVISAVAVLPEFQGKGLGRELINSALYKLSDKTVYLYCEKKNISFYQKMGFEICGEFSLHNTRGKNEKSF